MLDVMLWADAWPHDANFNGWPVKSIYLVYRDSPFSACVSNEYPIAVLVDNVAAIDGVHLHEMSSEDLHNYGLERL